MRVAAPNRTRAARACVITCSWNGLIQRMQWILTPDNLADLAACPNSAGGSELRNDKRRDRGEDDEELAKRATPHGRGMKINQSPHGGAAEAAGLLSATVDAGMGE